MNLFVEFPNLEMFVLQTFVAASQSRVTRKKTGALIIGQLKGSSSGARWEVLSQACNGVLPNEPHVFEKDGKTLDSVIHAEENAIAGVDWSHVKDKYNRVAIIITSSPCVSCATAILDVPEITDIAYVETYRDIRGLEMLAGRRLHDVGILRESITFKLHDAITLLNIPSVSNTLVQYAINKNRNDENLIRVYDTSTAQACIYGVITAATLANATVINNVVLHDDMPNKVVIAEFEDFLISAHLAVFDSYTDLLLSVRRKEG